MRILELRFKNLNSLYGEWKIDFTSPDYRANGIFALTGPTGAGKSTILDAVCLALYGTTPRLGKITQSSNEIMSRHTGECFAEVLFESQSGRFRCHWSQHRARRKADGKLSESRHEISDALSGQLLESKKRAVAEVIEEKTGMDFDRFTRSILLAQGGFDTFLRADAEEKSRILEQITGTEIYSEISRKVHERQRSEQDKLKEAQLSASGIPILSEEEEKSARAALEEKTAVTADAEARLKKAEEAIIWLHTIENLEQEIQSLHDETDALKKDIASFESDRIRLDQAAKAAELKGDFQVLVSGRKQQLLDLSELEVKMALLPGLESSVRTHDEKLQSAVKKTLKAREELKAAAPLIKKVREMDLRISALSEDLGEKETEFTKLSNAITDEKAYLETNEKDLAFSREKLRELQNYLEENKGEGMLTGELAGIEEQLRTYASLQSRISDLLKDREQQKAELRDGAARKKQHSAYLSEKRKELEMTRSKIQHAETALEALLDGRLLREYRMEKESLLRESAFRKRIADLESERSQLRDGKPCPLCGALEHPYARGNIPEMNEAEKRIGELTLLLDKAEEFETRIEYLLKEEKRALEETTAAEKLESESIFERDRFVQKLIDTARYLTEAGEDSSEQKKSLLSRLEPVEVNEIPDTSPEPLLKELRLRLSAWRDKQEEMEKIKEVISGLTAEIKRREAVIEIQNTSFTEKQTKLEALKSGYKQLVEERRDLFEQKNPDEEEHRLETIVHDREELEKQTRAAREESSQRLQSTREYIFSLEQRTGKRSMELETQEKNFAELLRGSGFSSEAVFADHLLTTEEREQLAAAAKELDDRLIDIQAREKDRKERLKAERKKQLSDQSPGALKEEQKLLDEELKELRAECAGLKHTLAENDTAREKMAEKQALIERQRAECRRWDNLHILIGSADGKKYRSFAQGLTFERMTSHANRQLQKMTDRYLLIRDEARPLELNVLDNYQAGEIRSTRNLSGGESFIVSLALALGLSNMASRKVRVDSLFLDEGFGSLDEESLETALETLAGLHQDGKLIGVISHVTALKDRISTRINITPLSGGKSTITGPGCMRIRS